MEVANILLGQPWLFNMDVTHFCRTNANVFKHERKKTILNPSKPIEVDKSSQMSQE